MKKTKEIKNPLRHLKKVCQINNLRIFLDESVCVTQFKVATPDNKILEEFCFFDGAANFCRETRDFLMKRKNISKRCNRKLESCV